MAAPSTVFHEWEELNRLAQNERDRRNEILARFYHPELTVQEADRIPLSPSPQPPSVFRRPGELDHLYLYFTVVEPEEASAFPPVFVPSSGGGGGR